MIGRRQLAALALLALAAGDGDRPPGRVIDAVTGVGVAGATLTLGGYVVRTDASGYFAAEAGTAPVQARAPGYRAAVMSATAFWSGGATLPLTPFRPRALYLSLFGVGSRAIRDAALGLIRAGRLNALVIDVKGDRGLIGYRSGNPLAAAVGAQRVITIPDLPALVGSLHAAGIYVIARIVVCKDDRLATARPDLAVRLAGGGLFRDREGLAWTDPSLAAVRDYNLAVAVEAVQASCDEIQFDYLRFPDAPRGVALAKPTTEASRLAAIMGFLAAARARLAASNAFVAADVFGYVCWNRNDTGIGQRLEEMAPLVDYLSPMLYPSGFQFGIPGYRDPVAHSYEVVRLSLERARARLGGSTLRFRPWLQAFRDYAFDRRAFGAVEVAAQIRAADDVGCDGWMLWNPRNTYSDAGLTLPVGRQPNVSSAGAAPSLRVAGSSIPPVPTAVDANGAVSGRFRSW